MCPRVMKRMECPECGYPYNEAMYALDISVPHLPHVPEYTDSDLAWFRKPLGD